MTTQRGFFGAITGVAAAAVGLRASAPATPDPMAGEIAALKASARAFEQQLAKPITVTLTIDSHAVARQVLKDLPRVARLHGLR